MNHTHSIDILMSTYNGSKYIESQIESIINQDYKHWSLLVRDDGSEDATLEIINEFALRDDRITIVTSDNINIGPAASFMQLLTYSTSNYFMLADQDDIWLPDKIRLTLNAIREHEYDSSQPCLVYTDLQVVDEQLNSISPSFLSYQRLQPRKFCCFKRELLQNIVTGCTLGGNAALRQKSIAVSTTSENLMIMHDWWIAMVAFYFGSVTYLPCSPILYRQHDKNQLGAKSSGIARYLAIFKEKNTCNRVHDYLNKVSKQCKLFISTYKAELTVHDLHLLQQIADSENSWSVTALLRCFWYGAGFKTIDCSLAFLVALLICQPPSASSETGT